MADRLEVNHLSKFYGKKHVVKDVSFSMESGDITGLLGPNGAGKTTSFYMIVGFIKANGGKILINGEDITSLPMHQRSKLGLAYLPQEPSIFRKLTVEDNIMLVLETQDYLSNKERKEKLEELLTNFGIDRIRRQYGYTLSGGERRRTEIARALATSPKFLLLDEPFAGVDPIAVEDIQYIIAKLKYRNIGVIITDHNVGETLAITDRAYLLYEGTILQEGTPQQLSEDDDVRTKYLGSGFVLKRSVSVQRAKDEYDAKMKKEKEND